MSSCTESETRKQRKPLEVIVVVGFFLIGIIVPIVLNNMDGYRAMRSAWPRDVQYLIHPVFRMFLVLIGWKQGVKGFAIGVLCSLPMLILGILCDRNSVSRDLVHSTIVPGLTEEIFYRAFAFGMFVQVLRLKLWPAAILTGLIFGLAHLISASVRAQPIMDQVGWIGMIAIGGLFYAWIYEQANWNLWVVIALHAAMNLWWDMFDLTSSPIGNIGATLSRILAVGLAIYFVVFRGVLRPPRSDAGSTIRA